MRIFTPGGKSLQQVRQVGMKKSLLLLYTVTMWRRENKSSSPGNPKDSEVTEANYHFLLSISEDGERTLAIIQSPPPCASCPCQCRPPSSISYRRVHLNSLPWQSLPVFNHHPQRKKCFLRFKQNVLYFHLLLLLVVLPLPRTQCNRMDRYRDAALLQITAEWNQENFQLPSSILTSAFLRASMAFISIICCLRLSRSYWSG